MTNRHNAKQEGVIDQIKKTYPNLKLIDHNQYANLWYPKDFEISNPNRFYRNIQSKIEQSLIDFHYAFSPLPDSYKVKILSGRNFQDFMQTIKQHTRITDKKQYQDDPEKLFSFMMYYDFFNVGIEGLMKLMPEEFKHHIREQLRDALLLMQSIATFTKNSGSNKKVPFVHAPDSLLNKGLIDNLQ